MAKKNKARRNRAKQLAGAETASQDRPAPGNSVLLGLAVVIPIATWLVHPWVLPQGSLPEEHRPPTAWKGAEGDQFSKSPLGFKQQPIGPAPKHLPQISNVQILDFDEDGLQDVIACDPQTNRVLWYRQGPVGTWEEQVLGEDLLAPAHATVADVDQDGDRDVVVSILGNIFPDDSVIGQVVLLENVDGQFKRHLLLNDVRRVADVQVGDLDGDGDLDMAVAVFGYSRGQVLWLENHGEFRYEPHELFYAAGTIHVPLEDYDGDGDLDIATVVSQEQEEVLAFENLGSGKFRKRSLFSTINYDIGSAGLVKTDLDRDGDFDFLLPVGDNFEDLTSVPLPYHGCFWLENRGDWDFAAQRIATFNGTYAASAGDLDADGDTDVVLVSMFNAFETEGNASVVWLENDGQQQFRTWQVADRPIHLITVACGDLDGDGREDIVAGGFNVQYPTERLGRITAWIGK